MAESTHVGGWYRCEHQNCRKTVDVEWAFIIDDDGVRRVYCSEECAKADGMKWK